MNNIGINRNIELVKLFRGKKKFIIKAKNEIKIVPYIAISAK